MMYLLSDGNYYLGWDKTQKPVLVDTDRKALLFQSTEMAEIYIKGLPGYMKDYSWRWENAPIYITEEAEELEKRTYPFDWKIDYRTALEAEGFDVFAYFKETITIMSQLDQFLDDMTREEELYNLKIMDVRHYIRDKERKLSAIQMQRLGYYLQDLERKRFECKSKRILATTFAKSMDELKNKGNIHKIDSLINSKYKPRVLEDAEIETIINTKRKSLEEERDVSETETKEKRDTLKNSFWMQVSEQLFH